MDKNPPLYPLKFTPILKEKIWGGKKLSKLFQKNGTGNIGESWELSGVDENVSVAANKPLSGMSLTNLIEIYGASLLGEKVFKHFGNTFPLLFKFIDAEADLSVQLHPNDTLAKERHNGFGKTEMWYIMHAEENARLILGFNRKMDESTYLEFLSENKLTEILKEEKVDKGDAFFIAPGTVHAIGAGVLLAEIQQTSDLTYRIYDWDRPDTDGTKRELHTELALAAINYEEAKAKITYPDKKNQPVLLKTNRYFETNKLRLTQPLSRDLSGLDSFVVYMCVDGSANLMADNIMTTMSTGETILVPACLKNISFDTTSATFLEVYIP
jgi:mannose-6-phosphate isomerase